MIVAVESQCKPSSYKKGATLARSLGCVWFRSLLAAQCPHVRSRDPVPRPAPAPTSEWSAVPQPAGVGCWVAPRGGRLHSWNVKVALASWSFPNHTHTTQILMGCGPLHLPPFHRCRRKDQDQGAPWFPVFFLIMSLLGEELLADFHWILNFKFENKIQGFHQTIF